MSFIKKSVLFILACVMLTAIGETKINNNNKELLLINKRISKILSNEKYHLARADNILKLKNIDSVLSINHLSSAMNNLQNSLQKKILAEDRSIIEVSPEMLADKHQDKFKTIFSYINREEMLDNLEVVNIIINKLKKVQDHSLFDYLILSKKEYFHKSDMSIHWLNYFISKKEIKINCYSKGTSLMQRVIERNNKDVAKLLMEKGYTPIKADIELLQFYEKHVVSDDYPFDDGEGALKELRSIEALLSNKINKQLK